MGYCGRKCDACPALRATKAQDEQALTRLADVWSRLLGVPYKADQLKCDGCYHNLGRKAKPECQIRPCCQARGYMTCAECGQFPCPNLTELFLDRDIAEAKLGRTISDEVYQLYLRPLENKARLDLLHRRHEK